MFKPATPAPRLKSSMMSVCEIKPAATAKWNTGDAGPMLFNIVGDSGTGKSTFSERIIYTFDT